MTMVRSQTHKLVHFVNSDEGQLFDLENDPNEVHNLWRKNSEQRQHLLDVLLNWRTQSTYQTARLFEKHR